jgi:alpha-beta hydrolase superfamily lysophospholipase
MARYNFTQGTFSGKGNVQIAYRGWAADKPKGVVVVVHGLGEHSGRYTHLTDALSGKKISIFALDNRGHGNSQGERGHIDSFLDFIFDLKIFINMVREAHPDLPIILLGHSMGGAIACRYALTYQNDIKGLVLSAPGIILINREPVIKRAFGKTLATLSPKTIISNGIDAQTMISHDAEQVKLYKEDPLVHSHISLRLWTEMEKNGAYCMERAYDLRIPLLAIHGSDDPIVSLKGSEVVVDRALTDDKKLAVFPGLLHETMNESPRDRAKVLSLVASWIVSHINPRGGKDTVVKVRVARTAKPAKAEAPKKVKAPAKKASGKKSPAGKKTPVKKPSAKKPVSAKKTKAKKGGRSRA